jgi:hypothetical protein
MEIFTNEFKELLSTQLEELTNVVKKDEVKIIDKEDVVVEILSKKGSLKEATANLYAAMHRLDTQNLDLIIAQKFPEIDLGNSINDRLERATKNK